MQQCEPARSRTDVEFIAIHRVVVDAAQCVRYNWRMLLNRWLRDNCRHCEWIGILPLPLLAQTIENLDVQWKIDYQFIVSAIKASYLIL